MHHVLAGEAAQNNGKNEGAQEERVPCTMLWPARRGRLLWQARMVTMFQSFNKPHTSSQSKLGFGPFPLHVTGVLAYNIVTILACHTKSARSTNKLFW